MTGIKYDVAKAMAAMIMSRLLLESDDFRTLLAEHSDIPEDRLDFAVSEITQGIDNIVPVLEALESVSDMELTFESLTEHLQGTNWTDDGKNEGSYSLAIANKDNETIAEVNVKTKLKGDE